MKTKQILLAIALFISVCVNAQDKYEFMTISQRTFRASITIHISTDGGQFLSEDVKITKEQESDFNTFQT